KRIVLAKTLFKACLEGAGLLRFQRWVRDGGEPASIPERLRERRLLDSGSVGEEKPRASKQLVPLEGQQRQRCPRHKLISEAFVMDEAPTDDKCQPLEGEHLLPKNRVIAPTSMTWKQRIARS